MVDYAKLYYELFNRITDMIEEMKRIQQKAEEIYINAGSDEEEIK